MKNYRLTLILFSMTAMLTVVHTQEAIADRGARDRRIRKYQRHTVTNAEEVTTENGEHTIDENNVDTSNSEAADTNTESTTETNTDNQNSSPEPEEEIVVDCSTETNQVSRYQGGCQVDCSLISDGTTAYWAGCLHPTEQHYWSQGNTIFPPSTESANRFNGQIQVQSLASGCKNTMYFIKIVGAFDEACDVNNTECAFSHNGSITLRTKSETIFRFMSETLQNSMIKSKQVYFDFELSRLGQHNSHIIYVGNESTSTLNSVILYMLHYEDIETFTITSIPTEGQSDP